MLYINIYIYIYIYKHKYANVVTDEGKDRNETSTLRKKMKLKELYKVGSESKLNSGPDSSVGLRVCTEFNGRGFKSHTGQTSIATF